MLGRNAYDNVNGRFVQQSFIWVASVNSASPPRRAFLAATASLSMG